MTLHSAGDSPMMQEPRFAEGDRIKATVDHMPGMSGRSGTVRIVRQAPPYYGVQMDGEDDVHKWLAEDEMEPAGGPADSQQMPSHSSRGRGVDHVATYVRSHMWAIEETKLLEIRAFLQLRSEGMRFTAEEIAARIGPAAKDTSGRRGGVAVIPLHGIISHRASMVNQMSGPGGTSTLAFARAIDEALAMTEVDTILVDVDSPGGTVDGVAEVANKLFRAREHKKIVAIANTTAASAAFWIASQAEEVIATPTGLVGSIGVFTIHEDTSKAQEAEGVKTTVISNGKFKGEGVAGTPLTEEAIADLQAKVDAIGDMFRADVARGRGMVPSKVRDGFGQGRAVLAEAALSEGMIDRIATFDETIERLASARVRAPKPTGRHASLEAHRLALL